MRKQIMRYLIALVVLHTFSALHAGESLPLQRPFRSKIPEIIVRAGQRGIDRQAFRRTLAQQVTALPGRFSLPGGFLNYVMLRNEQTRLGIPNPTAKEIAGRVALREQQSAATRGKEELKPSFRAIREGFDASLAQSGLTRGDIARAAEMELIFEGVCRKSFNIAHMKLVSPEVANNMLDEMRIRYNPTYRGLSAKIAATIGGRNYEREDIIDYCLLRAPDRVLDDTLQLLVDEALLMDEARRAKLVASNGAEALQRLLGPLLTPQALRQYYAHEKDLFAVIHTSHIFIAYDNSPGMAYRKQQFSPAQVQTAKQRAEKILQQIRGGSMTFADAVKRYSDCPSKRNQGWLGYIAPDRTVKNSLPAEVYALDRLQTAKGRVSPITLPPDVRILEALRPLQEGGISNCVLLPTGVSIVKRGETRYPTDPEQIMNFLGQYRFTVERIKLLEALKSTSEPVYLWKPETRITDERILRPSKELVMNPPARMRTDLAKIEMPEL